jgi:hypothetical protein
MQCEYCHRELAKTETVFRYVWPSKFGYPKRSSFCEACVTGKFFWGKFKDPNPCQGCGRPVRNCLEWKINTVVCSEVCRVKVHNSRRRPYRVQHTQKLCESCACFFAPRRTHSRFCSAACKQKAYRQKLFLRHPE